MYAVTDPQFVYKDLADASDLPGLLLTLELLGARIKREMSRCDMKICRNRGDFNERKS